jgi:hypothetical protein
MHENGQLSGYHRGGRYSWHRCCGAYFFGGYYSVAGTAAESSLISWVLTYVRTASIERHAARAPRAATRLSWGVE